MFDLKHIGNESDVEAIICEPLFKILGYTNSNIQRKVSIKEYNISKGSKTENYKPDYVILENGFPLVVIDAKGPSEDLSKYTYQTSGYALMINKKYPGYNPCKYCLLTNGKYINIYDWDNDNPIISLQVKDIKNISDISKITHKLSLRSLQEYSKELLKQSTTTLNLHDTKEQISLKKPTKDEIVKVFYDIHNLIYRKEKKTPTDGFYEFVKLFCLKMKNDKQLHDKQSKGEKISSNDIFFSTDYIDSQLQRFPNKDPVKSLFQDYLKDFEEHIRQGKKRIFNSNDELNLSLDTSRQVIEILEKYNLIGIDEDLNGRMFEVFLRSTVRGKELGQYFTPRDVVKYMVKVADPDEHTKILDACCGSGGFLIESLSYMINKVSTNKNLSQSKKEELIKKIKEELIIGADAERKAAMVARINMFVHQDGSSKIFHLDSLSKNIKADETLDTETKAQLQEAKQVLKEGTFQIILTNPPFATKYSCDNKDEKELLKDYAICNGKGSYNSNILFMERYYDLLQVGGEILTVIDDSLLNSKNQEKFRTWLRDRFHIKGVISLPFNTFVNASTTIKTSILHLQKKTFGEKSNDPVFMAICNNIGHDDSGKNTPERNNLDKVYECWCEFMQSKKVNTVVIENQKDKELLTCPLQIFTVAQDELGYRRDAFYYSPVLKDMQKEIISMGGGEYEIRHGKDFIIKKPLQNKFVNDNLNEVYRYIEVGSVNRKGDIVNYEFNTLENLPTRARMLLEENDVFTPKNISSLYSTCIIQDKEENLLGSTGFIVIQNKTKKDSVVLWSILRSKYIQQQMYYLAATAVQPEVSTTIFEKEVVIPRPTDKTKYEAIFENANKVLGMNKDFNNALEQLEDVL